MLTCKLSDRTIHHREQYGAPTSAAAVTSEAEITSTVGAALSNGLDAHQENEHEGEVGEQNGATAAAATDSDSSGSLWDDDYEDQWYDDRSGAGPALLAEDEMGGDYGISIGGHHVTEEELQARFQSFLSSFELNRASN